MTRRKLSNVEIHAREVKRYTDNHGGPDLYSQKDGLTCISCASLVRPEWSKYPGCGTSIDWKKYIVPFGKLNPDQQVLLGD